MIASKQLQLSSDDQQNRTPEPVFLVVCAGENDIGSGVPLNKSNEAMESLLKIFSSVTNTTKWLRVHLIFLGPKLEPWLQDDQESRKAYIQMSRSFARICKQYNANINSNSDQASTQGIRKIHYLDCLTLFCEGASEPGALSGGRAIPQVKYFDNDQLHLSNEGYRRWKESVEAVMRAILMDH
jgi:lysophospholipase L1-like esterase